MTTALLLIDLQQEVANRIAGGRVPWPGGAEDRVTELLALFRTKGWPVVHVHHDDADPAAPFRRDLPSGQAMACASPAPGEAVIFKSGSSAFAGTGLDAHLRRAGIDRLVICGAVTGFCVNSSVRAASDLGFSVLLAEDALFSFGIDTHDGQGGIGAEMVARSTLALLAADFATVAPGATLARMIGA